MGKVWEKPLFNLGFLGKHWGETIRSYWGTLGPLEEELFEELVFKNSPLLFWEPFFGTHFFLFLGHSLVVAWEISHDFNSF